MKISENISLKKSSEILHAQLKADIVRQVNLLIQEIMIVKQSNSSQEIPTF